MTQKTTTEAPKYFDAHTHAHFAAFEKDYKEVIGRALRAGVWMINVGTQKDTSRRAVLVAHEFEGVYAAVGLHPIHTARSFHDENELGADFAEVSSANGGSGSFTSRGEDFDFEYYKQLALDPKTVAIGECGLDYFRIDAAERDDNIRRQKDAFFLQMKLAAAVEKPLMVHCRNAFADLIDMLESNSAIQRTGGVIHFFTGTKEDAQRLIRLGFSFTFGGVLTFTHDYDEVVKTVPMDRLLSETDAPYITPVPYRGRRNEPAYVIEVVKKLAELKGVPQDEMRNIIAKNTEAIFGIDLGA